MSSQALLDMDLRWKSWEEGVTMSLQVALLRRLPIWQWLRALPTGPYNQRSLLLRWKLLFR